MVADHSCHRCGVLQVLHAEFNAIFDERAAKIQGNIAKAEQARKDADEAKAKYEAQLSTARVDAPRFATTPVRSVHIIADARSRAESDAAQITASAQRSIESSTSRPSSRSRARSAHLPPPGRQDPRAKLEDNDVQSSMIDSMIDDLGAKK